MYIEQYLKLLSIKYLNEKSAIEEIVNLNAILSLPKGTEYYLSDLHGEHEAFCHMVTSASGVIRMKIDENLGGIFSSRASSPLICGTSTTRTTGTTTVSAPPSISSRFCHDAPFQRFAGFSVGHRVCRPGHKRRAPGRIAHCPVRQKQRVSGRQFGAPGLRGHAPQ